MCRSLAFEFILTIKVNIMPIIYLRVMELFYQTSVKLKYFTSIKYFFRW